MLGKLLYKLLQTEIPGLSSSSLRYLVITETALVKIVHYTTAMQKHLSTKQPGALRLQND